VHSKQAYEKDEIKLQPFSTFILGGGRWSALSLIIQPVEYSQF
jgi:hypothetical protein